MTLPNSMRSIARSSKSIAAVPVVIVLGAGVALACAWFEVDDTYYSFFAPEVARSEEYQPFFRTFHTLYRTIKEDNVSDFGDANVAEWGAWLRLRSNDSLLSRLLYGFRSGEIDTLSSVADDLSSLHPGESMSDLLAAIPDPDRRRSFLRYLSFAKRCEPYVTFVPGWSWARNEEFPDPRKDTTAMNALLSRCDTLLGLEEDLFVRERLLFQKTRLLYHAGRPDSCIAFHERHRKDFSQKTSMRDRAAGYAAAALYRLKRYAEANYQYAVLYDRNPAMKTGAFLSFHPQEEADWKRSLSYARSERERAVLWHLLGIHADPLRAMREIADIDPGSDLLDLLLVRAINIAEESFLPERWTPEASAAAPRHALRAAAVDPELLRFVVATADTHGTHRPALWHLAAGYLLIARGEYDRAAPHLTRARQKARGDTLVDQQARILDFVRLVELPGALSDGRGERLARDLRWLNSGSTGPELRAWPTLEWARRRLGERYAASGDTLRAQLLDPYGDRAYYRDERRLERMLTFLDKPPSDDLDAFLRETYPFSASDIVELQAIRLMYAQRFGEAVALFERRTGSGDALLPGDPFLIRINDCHDCDHAAPKQIAYSKTSFARRMSELQAAAGSDAASCLLYANGLYNMTWYGNSRRAYENDLYESGFVDHDWSAADKSRNPFFDCRPALRRYRQAQQLSGDREFRARCCFLAAKCEQNAFFNSKPEAYKGDFRAGASFRELRKEYSKTRYYAEILRECGYFRTYAATAAKRGRK